MNEWPQKTEQRKPGRRGRGSAHAWTASRGVDRGLASEHRTYKIHVYITSHTKTIQFLIILNSVCARIYILNHM